MNKHEKLLKALEMCAGPDCSTECPYYGETRGGKTCRSWLLNDAAVALLCAQSAAQAVEEPGHARRARWVVHEDDVDERGFLNTLAIRCSRCSYPGQMWMRYCPNCGAIIVAKENVQERDGHV